MTKEISKVPEVPEAPEVSDGEESPVDNETESFEKMQKEPVVQDIEAGDIDKIESAMLESDVVITETELSESMEDEVAVVEEETEKIIEPVEEYTETASIPKDMMKKIIEGSKESIADKVQNNITTSEPQTNNIPAGDDAPFFEDKISNSRITGAASFNIKKHEYAPYYKHIKDKIRLYWLLQFGTDASINQETNDFKPVIVTFKALPSGKITDVKIVDSAGNELLASKVQSSIQNTPLDKFPEYVDEKYISVKFSYYFF